VTRFGAHRLPDPMAAAACKLRQMSRPMSSGPRPAAITLCALPCSRSTACTIGNSIVPETRPGLGIDSLKVALKLWKRSRSTAEQLSSSSPKSTPTTAQRRVSQNALRHGLATRILDDPEKLAQVGQLVRALAPEGRPD
jgi:hypothetical protein